MHSRLRHSLTASFLAAACGGGAWMAWNAFEGHLVEIRKGSVQSPLSHTSAIRKGPGLQEEAPELPSALTTSGVSNAPFQTKVEDCGNSSSCDLTDIIQQLIDCRATQRARYYYRQFMQEPVDGIEKFQLLENALFGDFHRRNQGEYIGMTHDQENKLMAYHARMALAELQKQIDRQPHDPAGNLARYYQMRYVLEYATYNIPGQGYVEKAFNIGIDAGAIEDSIQSLAGPALQQRLREFREFPADHLTPGSAEAQRYIDLYFRLSNLSPFMKDNTSYPDGRKVSETPEFAAKLMKETGMTVNQAQNFFRRAQQLLDQTYSAAEEDHRQAVTKIIHVSNEPFEEESRRKLRQCQYQPR